MAHARQQIRAAFATAVTGLTTTGARVHTWRAYELAEDGLPALRVYTPVEDIDNDDGLGDVATRRLTVVCEAVVRASSTVENTVDTICVEVEEAIAADETLGGVAEWCRLDAFESEIDDEAHQPTMLATLRFIAQYHVATNDVETPL